MNRDDLAVVSHELRSPVAALSGVLEALRDAERPVDVRHALLRVAVAACRDVDRIVSDMALFSVVLEPIELDVLAHDVVARARLEAPDKSVRFEARGGSIIVRGDVVRLRQVLANLVSNALAHTPRGASVRVVVTGERDVVRVAVVDAGAGIAAEHLARVFERGVRATATRPGEGIGLYVARAIARAHGGEIEASSKVDQGSTFTLVVPRDARPGGGSPSGAAVRDGRRVP